MLVLMKVADGIEKRMDEFVAAENNESSSLALIGKSRVDFAIDGGGSARFLAELSEK